MPKLIEVGIDCLTALEVKAGMSLPRPHRDCGSVLSSMEGVDTRMACTDDRAAIDRELEATIRLVRQGYGSILSGDHSIPDMVRRDTCRYFLERGPALGTY